MTALPLRPAFEPTLRALTNDLHATMEDALSGDLLMRDAFFECRADEVALLAPLNAADRRKTGCKTGIYSARPWITRNPAEAFEALIARGVLPDEWAGDVRRFFRCVCDGKPIATPARGGQAIPSCGGCGYYDEPGDPPRPDYAVPRPPTILALVAWASLGPPAIVRAEELALHGAHLLTIRPPVVVWRVAPLTPMPRETMLWQVERQRKLCKDANAQAPCDALYEMGLAWVYADDHAVTIVVPPIGGAP